MDEADPAVIAKAIELFKAEGRPDASWDNVTTRNATGGRLTAVCLTDEDRARYCAEARRQLGLPPLAV